MGTRRVAHGQVKVGQRAGRRAGPGARAALVTRRAARPLRAPAPSTRPQLYSFIARCLRSWEAARASATEFLATWTPLGLPDPPWGGSRPALARRGAAGTSRRRPRRSRRHAPGLFSVLHAWQIPLAVAGNADVLCARYPLVSALLVEMAAQRRAS